MIIKIIRFLRISYLTFSSFYFPMKKLVGSVPNYPHGGIDNIPELAKLAVASGVGLHVDCCLGGFVVAFAKDYGLNIGPFDFNVKGKNNANNSDKIILSFFFLRLFRSYFDQL